MRRKSKIDAIKQGGGVTTKEITDYAAKLGSEIKQIEGVIQEGVANLADLQNLYKLVTQGTAYAESAMEKLAHPGIKGKDQKALFDALRKFDQLQKDVFKKAHTKTLLNQAGVNSVDQKRFTDCMAQVQLVEDKIRKDDKIVSSKTSLDPLVLSDNENFDKCREFLASPFPNKTLKQALLNLKTSSGATLVDEMLHRELKVEDKWLQDWIYDNKLYGNTKAEMNRGITTALRIEKDDELYTPKSEPTMEAVERYAHMIESAVNHKTDITINDIDIKQLNADSLEKLLASGQLKMKDVMDHVLDFPVESLQAKVTQKLLRGGKLAPVKTVSETLPAHKKHKGESKIVISIVLDKTVARTAEADDEKSKEIKAGVEAFMRDALIQDLLTAENIEFALQNNLITQGTIEKWGKEGIITAQVLKAEMDSKSEGNTLEYHLVSKNVLVGKKQERIADWLDRKYPEARPSKENWFRDYDIKELQNRFNPIALVNLQEVREEMDQELEYDQLSAEDKQLSIELADTVSAGVKKDLQEKGRTNTVLNDLDYNHASGVSVEIFEAALSKVTEKEFEQLTTRLNPEVLYFIVTNNIPIGPNQKHPLLAIKNVDMSKSQDYDYMVDQLSKARVDEKGRPVQKGGTTLVGYMHKTKFKFKGSNAKTITDAIKKVKELEVKLKDFEGELKSIVDQAMQAIKGKPTIEEKTLLNRIHSLEKLIKQKRVDISQIQNNTAKLKVEQVSLQNLSKALTTLIESLKQEQYKSIIDTQKIKQFKSAITFTQNQVEEARQDLKEAQEVVEKQGSISSPFADKDPLNLVMKKSDAFATDAVAKDISAKDILSYYAEGIGTGTAADLESILLQRASKGHLVEVMCELIAENNKKGVPDAKKQFLKKVFTECQKQMQMQKSGKYKTDDVTAGTYSGLYSEIVRGVGLNKYRLLNPPKKAEVGENESGVPSKEELVTAFLMQEFDNACKSVKGMEYLNTGHKELDGKAVARIINKFCDAFYASYYKLLEGVKVSKDKLKKGYEYATQRKGRRYSLNDLATVEAAPNPPEPAADVNLEDGSELGGDVDLKAEHAELVEQKKEIQAELHEVRDLVDTARSDLETKKKELEKLNNQKAQGDDNAKREELQQEIGGLKTKAEGLDAKVGIDFGADTNTPSTMQKLGNFLYDFMPSWLSGVSKETQQDVTTELGNVAGKGATKEKTQDEKQSSLYTFAKKVTTERAQDAQKKGEGTSRT